MAIMPLTSQKHLPSLRSHSCRAAERLHISRRDEPKNASLRQLLLFVVFIGVAGLEVELALLRHATLSRSGFRTLRS
jgi:hypothetical protein